VLTNALHDPSSYVQNAAVQQLGMFGRDAKLAVPALVEFLNASHDDVNKFNATNALKAIDPEAAAKAGVN
jgi:HEAT repeat protein